MAQRIPTPVALPIDALLPQIAATLREHSNLILEAEPGAGKTTRVPAALLHEFPGQILVLEPRRIAARMAARRVAQERGDEPGQTVGYQVRFERVASAATRLFFLTEGVLTRRLLSEPDLPGVDLVILDEFHERHLETDLALALLRRLQLRRPQLRLLVMSATLDAAAIAAFLGDAPVLSSPGRLFDLAVEHLPYSPAPLEEQVRKAFERLISGGETGEILAFLPGAAEIRRAQRACEPVARRVNRLILPLYGDLSPAEQDRAVAPAAQPKLILATNVAESSITIDGVTAVIDSGLARIASHSPWTGLPQLRVGRISKASARQRAGRAGRTAAGRVLRLYPQADFLQRPDQETPELLRADLSQLCLGLRSAGILDPAELPWLDAPPAPAVAAAEDLLSRLGATPSVARALMQYPLPPRLARMIVAATERGVGYAACQAAALLASGARIDHPDILTALDAPLDERSQRLLRQLTQIARVSSPARTAAAGKHDSDQPLLHAILLGFPDRVGRRKSGNTAMLANGIAAEFASTPPTEPFFVALDIEDRAENPQPVIRLTAPILPEWLLDLHPDHVTDRTTLEWNRLGERVEAISQLLYDDLVLEESANAPADRAAAASLLAEKALEAGIERFVEAEALEDLLARIEFAGLDPVDLHDDFSRFCEGMRSFAELRAAGSGFLSWLEGHTDAQRLRSLAPTSLKLAAGRQTRIHYERGKAPWTASRLQDFFGMSETPCIGPARTPVVLHLLAPNRRPVQTTTDLAGFWQRLYPQVRRELMRRYPRHAWPERHDIPEPRETGR